MPSFSSWSCRPSAIGRVPLKRSRRKPVSARSAMAAWSAPLAGSCPSRTPGVRQLARPPEHAERAWTAHAHARPAPDVIDGARPVGVEVAVCVLARDQLRLHIGWCCRRPRPHGRPSGGGPASRCAPPPTGEHLVGGGGHTIWRRPRPRSARPSAGGSSACRRRWTRSCRRPGRWSRMACAREIDRLPTPSMASAGVVERPHAGVRSHHTIVGRSGNILAPSLTRRSTSCPG